MIHPAPADDERPNPTLCLDCGQSYFGTSECPSCKEQAEAPPEEPPSEVPAAEEPEITLPDETRQKEVARTSPTICLDCGETFIGTTECPSCGNVPPGARTGPEEPEIALPDDPMEEEDPIDAEVLLGEMRDLGFKVNEPPAGRGS